MHFLTIKYYSRYTTIRPAAQFFLARRLALFLGLGIAALLINYFLPRERVTALYDRVRGFKNS